MNLSDHDIDTGLKISKFKERILHSRKQKRPTTSKARRKGIKIKRKTSTNFYKHGNQNTKKSGMRMTFYKTGINNEHIGNSNFEFRLKGLPTIDKSHFKQNILFATNGLLNRNWGKGITLDKIFGANFKCIKVPVQVPYGFRKRNKNSSQSQNPGKSHQNQ